MAKRHQLDPRNWESIFRRLEELVLAGSGEDPFNEVFKLLVAQLASEAKLDATLLGETPTLTNINIHEALRQAERLWPTILGGDSEVRLRPEQLHECVAVINEISISDSSLEVMDGVFEFLMSRNHKGAKGQYFTPRHVIEAIVQIVDPSADERVLDPACGSSGFLLHTITHAQQSEVDIIPNVWGFDVDPKAVQVSKAMMLIAGASADCVARLDSLVTPNVGASLFASGQADYSMTVEDVVRIKSGLTAGFDAIITNPPFAGEIRDSSLISAYALADSSRRNERDMLFVERCVDLLRPGGRLAIVLPTGRMGSKSSSRMREWFLERMQLVGVLSLGRPTFQPHTTQKAEVVFGVKRPRPVNLSEITHEPILFMSSERSGKDSKGNVIERPGANSTSLWTRADHDLDEAVQLFAHHVAENRIPWKGKA